MITTRWRLEILAAGARRGGPVHYSEYEFLGPLKSQTNTWAWMRSELK